MVKNSQPRYSTVLFPSRLHYLNNSQVPSLVAYKSGKLVSWGFLADPVDSNGEIELYDNFKNLLGPDGLESFKPRKTDQPLGDGFDKVRQLHLDFFRELYIHIDKTLTNLAPFRQDGDDIEAIFSVPSTWNGSTLYHFRNLVKEAGLSSILRHHDQPVLLTEAEAVVESVLHELREQLPVSGADVDEIRKLTLECSKR